MIYQPASVYLILDHQVTWLPDNHPRPISTAIPAPAVLNGNIENRRHPAEKPFGILVTHIDTAVTHGNTEVIVPKGAVESDPGLENEEGCPGYSR